MLFVCGWEVFLEFPFPASVALDLFSHLWRMTAFVPQKIASLASFHKFVVKLSGSELDAIMAGDPSFQTFEANISPNHPSTTRHVVTVVHGIGLPFTWEAHHRLGTNFGKLLVRNHLSNLRFSTSFSEVFLKTDGKFHRCIFCREMLGFYIHFFSSPFLSFIYIYILYIGMSNQEQGPNQYIYSMGLGASQELPLPNFPPKNDDFEQKTMGFGREFVTIASWDWNTPTQRSMQ